MSSGFCCQYSARNVWASIGLLSKRVGAGLDIIHLCGEEVLYHRTDKTDGKPVLALISYLREALPTEKGVGICKVATLAACGPTASIH